MRALVTKVAGSGLVLLLLAAGAASCSAPGTGSKVDTSEPLDVDKGRQVFQTTCRACHALADANAAGVFGPDLDLLQPSAERVRQQIADGGGGMPADLLSGEDADLVARYVAKVAGAAPEREGEGGARGTTKQADG